MSFRSTRCGSSDLHADGISLHDELRHGELLDLKPLRSANLTCFTLSSGGKPAPVND
jgi:hypothetical protein